MEKSLPHVEKTKETCNSENTNMLDSFCSLKFYLALFTKNKSAHGESGLKKTLVNKNATKHIKALAFF